MYFESIFNVIGQYWMCFPCDWSILNVFWTCFDVIGVFHLFTMWLVDTECDFPVISCDWSILNGVAICKGLAIGIFFNVIGQTEYVGSCVMNLVSLWLVNSQCDCKAGVSILMEWLWCLRVSMWDFITQNGYCNMWWGNLFIDGAIFMIISGDNFISWDVHRSVYISIHIFKI